MGIEIKQPMAKLVAKAGALAGQAKKKEQKAAQAQRQQELLLDIELRRAAEERAMAWELEKMQMRSQQEFQQELRNRQYEYEKFNRAKEWELEKAEIASRMDFQRQEQKRSERLNDFDVGIKAIDKHADDGMIGQEEANQARYRFAMKFSDLPDAAPYLGFSSKQQSLLGMLGGQTPSGTTTQVGTQQGLKYTVSPKDWTQAILENSAWVRSKEDGTVKVFSVDVAEQAVKEGKAEWVKSPIKRKKPISTPSGAAVRGREVNIPTPDSFFF